MGFLFCFVSICPHMSAVFHFNLSILSAALFPRVETVHVFLLLPYSRLAFATYGGKNYTGH